MLFGGLQQFSLLDYPGHISAIIFTQGCNFRCRFCYNPMLVLPAAGKIKKNHRLTKEDDFFNFLKTRVGKLEGVVVTGGEPTLHADLPDFLKKIKKLGFKVKLDTNGTNPEMLEELGSIVDYIAMDIKAPLEKYETVTGVKINPIKSGKAVVKQFNGVNLRNIKKSVKIIMRSGITYEFRTTLVPGLHTEEDVAKIGEIIKGADKWFLQFFKGDINLLDAAWQGKKAFSEKEMEEMAEIGRKYVKKCEIR